MDGHLAGTAHCAPRVVQLLRQLRDFTGPRTPVHSDSHGSKEEEAERGGIGPRLLWWRRRRRAASWTRGFSVRREETDKIGFRVCWTE